MQIWRETITRGRAIDPYEAVLEELSSYYQISREEADRRCQNWEEESVEQWHAEDRSSNDKIVEFFQTQTSWVFDTMRYHADQCKGAAFPESVEVAHALQHLTPGKLLDFGAGPGTSAIFFRRLGWQVALSDISTTFLEFAKWRLAQHQTPAEFYDTTKDRLPSETFDLITAFDVIVHIPNVKAALLDIHRALRPGGYFVFNIDSRPRGPTTEYHFFENDYPVLRHVRSSGFRAKGRVDFFYVYQKADYSDAERGWISIYDRIRYSQMAHHLSNPIRRLIKRR